MVFCVMNEMHVFWMRIVASVMMKQAYFETRMKCFVFGGEIYSLAVIHVGNVDCMNSFGFSIEQSLLAIENKTVKSFIHNVRY